MGIEEKSSVNIGSLGPSGVLQRMQELQAKLDSATGGSSFDSHLPPQSELSGTIGGGGVQPFNPMGAGASLSPIATPSSLRPLIEKAAGEAGVDPNLLDALVATESGYNPGARSKVGAMGLTQLMPQTAQGLGVTNPFDPYQSLQGGAKYLASMIQKFGDPRLALAAYNAGPGAVEKAGNAVPNYPETQNYVTRVMGIYAARKGG